RRDERNGFHGERWILLLSEEYIRLHQGRRRTGGGTVSAPYRCSPTWGVPAQRILEGDGHVQGQDHVRPDGRARRVPVGRLEAVARGQRRLTGARPIMLELAFESHRRRVFRVLCVGAHCDDIEIGCGATLRLLQERATKPSIDWVILSGSA